MLALFAVAALGADWPMLQGTEPEGATEVVRPWGFVQAVAEGIVFAKPAEALSESLSALEGQRAQFNRVGSGDASWGFALRRVRLGLRGVVPETGAHVSYLVSAELGEGSLTRSDPVVLTDASLTLSYLPGVHLRAGQFKLPLGEEALEMNPSAAEFVNVTAATGQLLLESPVEGGAYTGGASGYRDVGIEAFDSAALGKGELSYALMLSNGQMGSLDIDDAKDVTARLAITPWIRGQRRSPQREELGVYVFWQQGEREIDGQRAPRVREGGGVKLERSGLHARAEVIAAQGVVELGPNPPFPGQPVEVSLHGQAIGGYGYVHYQPGLFGAGLRYDELHKGLESAEALRVSRTLTLDAQLQLSSRARVLLDYEIRRLVAPSGSPDAKIIAGTMGDRISLQAAAIF